jgi:hypothetical protein
MGHDAGGAAFKTCNYERGTIPKNGSHEGHISSSSFSFLFFFFQRLIAGRSLEGTCVGLYARMFGPAPDAKSKQRVETR